VPQRRGALEKLVLHATNLRIPIVEVEGGSLTSLAGFDGHQGIALVVEPRRYAGLADILARAAERGEPPFVLVLDSLQDPHNVGSLLRSAEAAGVHGVVFPRQRQAPLSPSAVKASAGAVEHLLLAPVDDLPEALSDLRAQGLRVAGADGDAPLTARQSDLRGPLAIVVGSEGQGLGSAVRRRSDLFVRIPMRGAVGSLNAAVAGSILLFEAVAQRDLPEAVRSPAPPLAPALAEDMPTDAESEIVGAGGTDDVPDLGAAPDPGDVPAVEPRSAPTPTRRSRKSDPHPSPEPVAPDGDDVDDLLPTDGTAPVAGTATSRTAPAATTRTTKAAKAPKATKAPKVTKAPKAAPTSTDTKRAAAAKSPKTGQAAVTAPAAAPRPAKRAEPSTSTTPAEVVEPRTTAGKGKTTKNTKTTKATKGTKSAKATKSAEAGRTDPATS
jgi:23S rRNA (guanosine2251-2'-O)-methyltransferase